MRKLHKGSGSRTLKTWKRRLDIAPGVVSKVSVTITEADGDYDYLIEGANNMDHALAKAMVLHGTKIRPRIWGASLLNRQQH